MSACTERADAKRGRVEAGRLLWIGFLAFAGCFDFAKEYPERRYHDVTAARSGAARAGAAGTVLKVRRFRISPRFEGTELVRRTGESGWEQDYYHVFFVPPAAMMTEEAKRWIAASGLFASVVDFASYAEATHVLEGNVSALYGDARGAPKAVLELQVFLLDDRVAPPSVMFQKDYKRSVDVADAGAESMVGGWSRALGEILTELEGDLAGAMKNR